MNKALTSHNEAQKLIANLGRRWGFDVELPDEKRSRYLRRKRPDVIWRFRQHQRTTSRYLRFHEPYAIFEVESREQWRDIRRHLKNLLQINLRPCKFFAVFYDGNIEEDKKRRLLSSNPYPDLEIIFLSPRELEALELSLREGRGTDKAEDVTSFLQATRLIQRLTRSKVFTECRKALDMGRRQIVMIEKRVYDEDIRALKGTNFARLIPIKNRFQETSGYVVELSPEVMETIKGLSLLVKDKEVYPQPFFPDLKQALKSPPLKRMSEIGVEAYLDFIVNAFKKSFNADLLDKRDISDFMFFLWHQQVWRDIFTNLLKLAHDSH